MPDQAAPKVAAQAGPGSSATLRPDAAEGCPPLPFCFPFLLDVDEELVIHSGL